MRFQSFIALSMGFLTAVSATNKNIGCNNCLGESTDSIRYRCMKLCGDAFPAASSEVQVCREYCDVFVIDKKCCSGTCSSDANTCMNTFFPPADNSLAKKSTSLVVDTAEANRIHARDLVVAPLPPPPASSSKDVVSVPLRRDPAALLGPRVNYGDACCKAAKSVLAVAAKPVYDLVNQQRWNEDTASGVILVGFGLASAFTCSKLFQVNCVFVVDGVDGELGGGALPNRDEL